MKHSALYFLLLILPYSLAAQDTFSIVAVDTLTGEVGSAGASCIDQTAIAGGARIISDVIPGRGAIHTQSYWHATNQQNAHNRMLEGLSPQQIIDWLVANDVQNQAAKRQYGIVDFDADGSPRAASFTGEQCMNWKGHRVGKNYAIQGNILLNQGIVDSIEARFLHTGGSLADKLMAALQGAKVPGADSRCLNQGVSSLSAFIRMAKATNSPDSLYLDLNVPQVPYGTEPIDSLQSLYDNWKAIVALNENSSNQPATWKMFPNPAQREVNVELIDNNLKISQIAVFSPKGETLLRLAVHDQSIRLNLSAFALPYCYIVVMTSDGKQSAGKLLLR